jgi:hypothetical protein
LTAADFARVNPNTGTAPVFRSRRDAALTTAVYARLPVLVDRTGPQPVSAWPVRYVRMLDMTNDSGLFRDRRRLEEEEGAWPVGDNIWESASGRWLPLYVGRMIHQFNHRAASVEVNAENFHNAALSADSSEVQKRDPRFVPIPQYWVPASEVRLDQGVEWVIAFRDIARATDARTFIASVVPRAGYGNKLPLILAADTRVSAASFPLLLANLNSIIFDFVARSKVHSTSLNWFIVEQLPVVPPHVFESTRFGPRTAGEIVRQAVLELIYTAHDLAAFARDLGHVGPDGAVLPPFAWDPVRRLRLRARLDAVFFHLYGVFDPADRARSRDDVAYVYSTFPIVERQETAEHGRYLSRDLCLAYCNTLAAGQPYAEPELD